MQTNLTIALAQLEITTDPAVNLSKAEVFTHQAASQGADIIVFPEMFMGLPTPDRPPIKIVEDCEHTFIDRLKTLSSEMDISITAGCWENCQDSQRVYNTAYTFSPKGGTIAAYRKMHLFDALSVRESDTMVPGTALPPVVEIAGIRVGFAICYDLRFPELFRYLSGQGAQLIIVPSGWYQGPMKEDHWLTLLRARAIENTLYVAGCNLIGSSFCGRSSLFDPFGVQLVSAGEEETLLLGKINANRIDIVRQKLPCLLNRRSDLLPG
jgi:predicted amidohydrolase